ncbi:MAG: autoinducer binding domain-containing protein [Pseudomonadota bacterium]
MSQPTPILPLLESLDQACPGGYAVALHVKFTTPRYLFQTYPETWNAHYTQNGYVMQDPTVHWGFQNTGIKPWADLKDHDPAGILAQAAEFGLAFGFTYATDAGGSRSVTSFARADRSYTAEECAAIAAVIDTLHAVTGEDRELTAEDKATLRLRSVVLPG